MRIAVQDLRPTEPCEAVGQTLRLGRLVDLHEGVVLEDESGLATGQLLSEPVVSVDADLQRERGPCLQTNVDETEIAVEKIPVKDPLLPRSGDEPGSLGSPDQIERVAGFQSAEDADETGLDALFAKEPFGPLILAEGSGAIEIGASELRRLAWHARPAARPNRSEDLEELAASNAEDAIHEAFEFFDVRQGKMAFEENAIEQCKTADDEAGELGREPPYCAHGILPRSVVVSTNQSGGRMPFSLHEIRLRLSRVRVRGECGGERRRRAKNEIVATRAGLGSSNAPLTPTLSPRHPRLQVRCDLRRGERGRPRNDCDDSPSLDHAGAEGRDLDRAIAWYADVLGFEPRGRQPDDGDGEHCFLHSADVELLLSTGSHLGAAPAFTGTLYFRVEGVDELFAKVRDRAEIVWPLETMDYGTREFGIRDPDGYVLAFAQASPAA